MKPKRITCLVLILVVNDSVLILVYKKHKWQNPAKGLRSASINMIIRWIIDLEPNLKKDKFIVFSPYMSELVARETAMGAKEGIFSYLPLPLLLPG